MPHGRYSSHMGRDQAEHDQRLKQVLDRLVERKLTLNLEKCYFLKVGCNTWAKSLIVKESGKIPQRLKLSLTWRNPRTLQA